MKLDAKEFSEFKKLMELMKQGKLSDEQKARLAELTAKKQAGKEGKPGKQDISWWNKYPDLLKNASNVPFNTIKGATLRIDNVKDPEGIQPVNILSGARISYLRTIGNSVTSEDAFNYQMRMLYLDMHRKYRGMGGYEWADLGIIEKAIVDCFADIARAEKIYGLLNEFQIKNRTIPNQLLTACGLSANIKIVQEDIANFHYQLNRIIVKMSSLCLPQGIAALQSYIELESNVYKDSDTDRAAWIVYECPYVSIYDPMSLGTGGCIRMRARTSGTQGYGQLLSDIITDLDAQTSALLSDTDVAKVCSDMIACYGESGVVTLAPIPELYHVPFVYNKERMMQLHNTTIVGNVGNRCPMEYTQFSNDLAANDSKFGACIPSLTIYQYDGCVVQDLFSMPAPENLVYSNQVPASRIKDGPNFIPCHLDMASIIQQVYFTLPSGNTILDIWQDSVSGDDVVEMTRQTAVREKISFSAKVDTGTEGKPHVESRTGVCYHVSYGTILCTEMQLYYYVNGKVGPQSADLKSDLLNMYADVVNSDFKKISLISQMDWHPKFWIAYWAITDSTLKDPELMYDVDNYAVASTATIEALHDACVLSGYKINLTATKE